jgi:hypothetical protein
MSEHLAGLKARSRREGEFDDTRSPSNPRKPTVDRAKPYQTATSSMGNKRITQSRFSCMLRSENDDLVLVEATIITRICKFMFMFTCLSRRRLSTFI